MDLSDRNAAMTYTQALIHRCRAAGCPPAASADIFSQSMIGLLQALARERRETADLLTQVMRLPFTWRAAAMCALKGEAPYEHEGANILVTVRNISTETIDVMVGLDWIADQRRGRDDVYVAASTGHGRERMKPLAQGEDIELRGHFAALALSSLSRSAHEPALWESSSALPDSDLLIEVGYKCPGWGDEYTSTGKPRGRKGEKAA